jgi:hypothetical protein
MGFSSGQGRIQISWLKGYGNWNEQRMNFWRMVTADHGRKITKCSALSGRPRANRKTAASRRDGGSQRPHRPTIVQIKTPPARRDAANCAGRKVIDHFGKHSRNPDRKLAVAAVEMRAFLFFAARL